MLMWRGSGMLLTVSLGDVTKDGQRMHRNANTASTQKTQSYAAQIPANAQGAAADPNAVTLTGPGGNSVSLGRRLLREASLDDL